MVRRARARTDHRRAEASASRWRMPSEKPPTLRSAAASRSVSSSNAHSSAFVAQPGWATATRSWLRAAAGMEALLEHRSDDSRGMGEVAAAATADRRHARRTALSAPAAACWSSSRSRWRRGRRCQAGWATAVKSSSRDRAVALGDVVERQGVHGGSWWRAVARRHCALRGRSPHRQRRRSLRHPAVEHHEPDPLDAYISRRMC